MITSKVNMVTTQCYYSQLQLYEIKMHEIKTVYQDVDQDFSIDKEMFDLSNYSTKSKYDNSNKLVVGKMKDETAGFVIEHFVNLKPKMYLYQVDDN